MVLQKPVGVYEINHFGGVVLNIAGAVFFAPEYSEGFCALTRADFPAFLMLGKAGKSARQRPARRSTAPAERRRRGIQDNAILTIFAVELSGAGENKTLYREDFF